MKLYVCNEQDKQLYINVDAKNRRQLARIVGGQYFTLKRSHKVYDVNDVYAEAEDDNFIGSAALGGIIGLLGGPVGFILGGTVGGLIGNSKDDNEIEKVNRFNRSNHYE